MSEFSCILLFMSDDSRWVFMILSNIYDGKFPQKQYSLCHSFQPLTFFQKSMIIDFCHGPHCVKSIRIRSFSGPYFLTFAMNTEKYSVSLRIQSNRGKTRTKKTRNTDTFLAVPHYASGQVSAGSIRLLFIFRGVFRTQFLQKTSIVNFRLHSKYASDTVDTTL